MLHLYVWGPAFSLPSIDAECLAVLTYLHNALPSSEWRLIPSNDPSVSPSDLLPALDHDGVWTSGYRPIVHYLTSKSLCRDLDENLSPAQQADSVAWTAFLLAHAAPLVDLSLYVSAANWSTTTRPAYSSLLPFPLTWTLPPLIRTQAFKRAEHLGLAELDTDFDPNGGLHLTAGKDALPETFRRHLPAGTTKKTVRQEMTPEQAAAIRLHSLAEDCLTVVDSLLGEQQLDGKSPRFFDPASPPSSLDCLAYGLLALMVVPPMPRSFLKDWVQAEAPRLALFVESMTPADLTWMPAVPATLPASGARAVDSMMRSVPGLGEHYASEMRYRLETGTGGMDQRALVMAMSLVVTGAAVSYGFRAYKTSQPFGAWQQVWTRRPTSSLGHFGELGSMLNSAMGAFDPGSTAPASTTALASGRLVEASSDLD